MYNIKILIKKINRTNEYYFSIMSANPDFIAFLENKALHINHIDLHIRRNDSLYHSYIDDERFSIYLSKYNRTMIYKTETNKLFRICSNISRFKIERINTDIKDFDIKVVKAFKALSDAYDKNKK